MNLQVAQRVEMIADDLIRHGSPVFKGMRGIVRGEAPNNHVIVEFEPEFGSDIERIHITLLKPVEVSEMN